MNRYVFIVCLLLCISTSSFSQSITYREQLTALTDSINLALHTLTKGNSQIKLANDSAFIIYFRGEHYFRVNLLHLDKDDYSDSPKYHGIRFDSSRYDSHVPNSFIHFESSRAGGGVISFYAQPNALVHQVYKSFVRMYDLMEKMRYKFAVYSNSDIPTNHRFFEILRPTLHEKKYPFLGKMILYGAGMSDADSVPTGEWKFFSKPEGGYLVCRGNYAYTDMNSFVIDASFSDYNAVDTNSVKAELTRSFPFLKTGDWNYYNEKGEIIRTVNFPSRQLPVFITPVITDNSTRYMLQLPRRADEWELTR